MASTEGERSDGSWLFVVGEATTAATFSPEAGAKAMAAAPLGVRTGGQVLPRRKHEGDECCICGRVEPLSREHVPPRSAGNIGRSRSHTLSEWLARESLDEVPGGRFEQGGVWGYTLCVDCNSRTGRLSGEYRRWAEMAARLFTDQIPDTVEEIDRSTVTKGVTFRIPNSLPGTFARQVLSLMCSVAGPWKLTEHHPELRGALLDGDTCPLPEGLALGVALCAGPSAFIAGPSLILDTAGRWRWIAVMAHPPLAVELQLAASGQGPPSPMCEIGHFLTVSEAACADVDLDLIIGFTHTMFPGDWRTRRQIEDKLGLDGLPAGESAW